jgi:hypothetical protein
MATKPKGAIQSIKEQMKPFQLSDWKPNLKDVRPDGTLKGAGYFGTLKRPDGGVSGEISIGTDFGHGEMDIPTMVPTLAAHELHYLLTTPEHQIAESDPKIFQSIRKKAVEHAKQRMLYGKPVFAEEHEEGTHPTPVF